MIKEKAKEVIRKEAKAVALLEKKIDENFVRAVELILKCKGRVIVTGIGKSGIIGKKIAATLTSTGTASFFLHPTEGIHGDLGMVRKNDVVVAITKSGGTDEVYQLIPLFKRLGVPIITFTGDLNSPVAEKSDVVIDVSVDQEACPHNLIPTSSTTAALVMGDALAIALLEERHFSSEDFALLHPGGHLGRKLILKVSDIMHTGDQIPVVSDKADMKQVILEMTSKRLGTTTVVNQKRELVGVFTDGDLRRLVERTDEIFSLRAGQVMTKNPKTIDGDELAAKALNLMESYSITSLIIANGKREPIGIVHLHDILKAGVV
ncbi:MAG: KpsF/GutQ family sugar-phosphate isomerase [candidate division Zixibacteria bacterium]|nr:KpsF/GutQ family sugar-phosphate isomerase [candidate division Zixibacteria bacterium]